MEAAHNGGVCLLKRQTERLWIEPDDDGEEKRRQTGVEAEGACRRDGLHQTKEGGGNDEIKGPVGECASGSAYTTVSLVEEIASTAPRYVAQSASVACHEDEL